LYSVAQESTEETIEQQLESLTEMEETEAEDDSYPETMARFLKHPLDLNIADAGDLRELQLLTDLQIDNFFLYRKLFGKLISLYELQAVPSWDINTIKKLLPFIAIGKDIRINETLAKRLKAGEHSLLGRVSQVMEKSVGYTPKPSGSYYNGSRLKIFSRYRYQYKNLLQYGITGDKDAGEQFFRGKQQYGFDFYSFHLFVRKIGIIESFALGDFTLNLGQGLIQWQSLAFKKSAWVTGIKRQSEVLRPYTSAGEFNFHRGAGITIKKGNFSATSFVSLKKISSNIVKDSTGDGGYVTSFNTSGYHRTPTELAHRKNLQQTVYGGNISWRKKTLHLGINTVQYHFSLPFQKRDLPYNLFSIKGNSWSNYSIDYSTTLRNIHFFGEAAIDQNLNKAILNGLLASVDAKVDLSLLHRVISPEYQSLYSNAFTENISPSNENGFYAGISIRPVAPWQIDAYADMFRFPWLKYLVDAPSTGKDFFVQLVYTPNKQIEIYTRYHNKSKESNSPGNRTVSNYLAEIPKQNWRTQISYRINKTITVKNRVELLWYGKKDDGGETGFLGYADLIYNPPFKPFSGGVRLQYFETDGYHSRIYAYENDVLYSYSIPMFYKKGFRYYLNFKYDFGKKFTCWLKFSRSGYPEEKSLGSGLDKIGDNKRTEVKFQALVYLNRK
jgi:hypothetical protein